jgi:soluble lytic murein transglycosylase
MQFIPETATAVATRMGMGEMSPDRMYQPEVSIRLGANYWAELLEEFGSPEMALAAYNGGPENVRRWSAKTRSTDPVVFLSDIGFTQTKDYVSRIFGLYARYRHLQDIE